MRGIRAWLGRNLKIVTVSAVSALVASAAVAIATVPDGNGTIHSCYEIQATPGGVVPKVGGPNLRIIDPSAGQSCDAASELGLEFNRQGPTGPVGIPGPTGFEGPHTTSPADECATVVGHLKLTAALQSDVCVIRQVKIGARSAAVGGPNGPTTQFEFTRLTDGLSPKLMKATTEGTQYGSANIQVFKPGTKVVAKTFALSHASIIWFKAGQGQNKPTDELAIAAIPNKKTQ